MCPACLTTAAWLIAGTGSAGGLAVFSVKKWKQRKRLPPAPTATNPSSIPPSSS